jgi:predicted TIM-barrel fold metal-dependent hydrolase
MKGIGEIRIKPSIFKDLSVLRPILQLIEDYNLILLTHSSEPAGHIYPAKGEMTPDRLYSLTNSFPGIKLVCAHWGGGLPFYALMPEVKKSLANVYFDTAASPFLYQPQVYQTVSQLVDSDKILFGTDYQLLTPKRLLSEINGLELPDLIKNQILSENAKKILRIY